jgi:hypothetical protein
VAVVGLSSVADSRDVELYSLSPLIERRVDHSNCSSFDLCKINYNCFITVNFKIKWNWGL